MQRWEYMRQRDPFRKWERMGTEGWELVAVVADGGAERFGNIGYFKRPLPTTPSGREREDG